MTNTNLELVDNLKNQILFSIQNSLTEDAAKCLMTRGTIRVDEEKWSFRRDLRVRSPTIYRFSHELSMNFLTNIQCHLLIVKAKSAPTFGGPEPVIAKTLGIYKAKCASFEYVEVEGNHFVHLNEPKLASEHINNFFLNVPKSVL